MSGKTELVNEPDTDSDIKEFKLENTDADADATAGGEDTYSLNTEQEFQKTKHIEKKRKRDDSDKVYPCDQCDFAATQLGNLKTYKESTPEGIRYP